MAELLSSIGHLTRTELYFGWGPSDVGIGGGLVDGGAITLGGTVTLSRAGSAELLPTFIEEATGGAATVGLAGAGIGAVSGAAFEVRSSE